MVTKSSASARAATFWRLTATTIATFVVRFVAVARRVRRRGRGGPQHRAVAILIHRLEPAARLSVAVRQHQTLALGAEADARLLIFLAVRLVGVDVAAARLLRRRLRKRAVGAVARDPSDARCRLLALFARVARQAHVLALRRVRFAAALLL